MDFLLEFNLKRCLVRSLLVGLAVLIGELVPKFDLVMGVIGGTLTGPLIFVLPPLFYSKILRLEAAYDQEVIRIRRNRTTLDDDSGETSTTADTDVPAPKTSPVAVGYGTFGRSARSRWRISAASGCWTRVCRAWHCVCSDCTLSAAVIGFGLAATVASTYFSALHVQSLREFWSPCIHNISYSFATL